MVTASDSGTESPKKSPEEEKQKSPEKKIDEKKTATKKPSEKPAAKSPGDKKTSKTKFGKLLKSLNLKVGISRYGRARKEIIKKIVKPHIKKADKEKKKTPLYVVKPIGGEKNGGQRVVLLKKPPAYYPAEARKRKRPILKKPKAAHLKKSLTPGTVGIVVAGPHKGKRVIFLKQLLSGLCLITGPFTFNKCPLRRINQIYLIGTSVKLDISNVEIPETVNDKYFQREKLNRKKAKKDEGDIFASKTKKYVVRKERVEDQVKVDAQILKAIKKHGEPKAVRAYLCNKFRLRNNQFPHALKF